MDIRTPPLQSLSILLVLPSKVAAKFIAHHLQDLNDVSSVCVTNAQSALSAMRTAKPDLVISSMYFDDGDGIDLITAMRNETALESILFMLISAEERFAMLDPIRQAGVMAILPKPFSGEDIQQAISLSHNYLSTQHLLKSQKDTESLRILLVDDSRLARKHMRRVLAKLGVQDHQLTEADDGATAVELLKENAFDLVLTDYNMPQMDGEELLMFIRKQDNLKNMPVIMVTSEENETKLGSIKSNGITAMLDKPFEAPHLRELLDIHMSAAT
ncbi:MAG: response regulator [Sinobacterium sp.]|nr:response regulator [Sinobacterium sp.]